MTSHTETLARFACESSFDDLPRSTVRAAKRLLLDTLGCVVGGRSIPSTRAIAAVKVAAGGIPEATALGGGERLSRHGVGFINAHSANSTEADDTFRLMAHLAACIVPSALAVAEAEGSSGRELLTAIAVGYDVAARVGLSIPVRAASSEGHADLSMIGGVSWVTFGAAAAAGRLIGLDADQMANAFGIAVLCAPVQTREKLGKGVAASPRPMTKGALYGAMADAGISAAMFARAGFTGDARVLDGEQGFWRIMGASHCVWDALSDRLGQRWLIEETSFKLHPANRWAAPALDLFYALRDETGVHAEEIERVEVLAPQHVVDKQMDQSAVRTVVDGQYSIPHLIALAALSGPSRPSWHSSEAIDDPQLAAFARRVDVSLNAEAAATMDRVLRESGRVDLIPTIVSLTARGRTYRRESTHTRGDPSDSATAASDSDLVEKFRRFCSPSLPAAQVDSAISVVHNLEAETGVDRLVATLVADDR